MNRQLRLDSHFRKIPKLELLGAGYLRENVLWENKWVEACDGLKKTALCTAVGTGTTCLHTDGWV